MKVSCYQCRQPADPRWFLHRADGAHPACDGCGCAGASDQLCAFCQGVVHERQRCAKIADELHMGPDDFQGKIAALIRAGVRS